MKPSLGTIDIDLPRLLETRMLIQSNSGGGKSFCLRRVLEQTAPHVQQLVIDPEGEFATLREKHDYIVCAPRGADAVANPHTAAALAIALWKARTSAILDIYELKAHERILFVRRFLEALVNAPRAPAWALCWRRCGARALKRFEGAQRDHLSQWASACEPARMARRSSARAVWTGGRRRLSSSSVLRLKRAASSTAARPAMPIGG